MEKERLSCEEAWKLNRENLIRMANRNTFLALATAFETGWELATEGAKKNDGTTDSPV